MCIHVNITGTYVLCILCSWGVMLCVMFYDKIFQYGSTVKTQCPPLEAITVGISITFNVENVEKSISNLQAMFTRMKYLKVLKIPNTCRETDHT